MPLVAVPNVSEGRDEQRLLRLERAIEGGGGLVLDMHADATHNRAVFTVAGPAGQLTSSMVALAVAAGEIDLTMHEGVHPRLGALDVCPFVHVDEERAPAVEAARAAGAAIADATGLPVYLYEEAATRRETASLPALRRGGLAGLRDRISDLPPDFGPAEIDLRRGVVCVGARGPLVAFNVWLHCSRAEAEEVAAKVRRSTPGLRALGLAITPNESQVSMNLVEPHVTGIDTAFEAVADEARARRVDVLRTEIVGLPPRRFMPDPQKEAARLLMKPGRSLESELERI